MSDLGIERIVVILEPGGEHRTSIDAAIELASTLHLPLHAIFAEDEALLDLASLSVASHLDLGNRMMRSLETGLLTAAIKVEARRCSALLEQSASAAKVPATFTEWRGQPTLKNLGARDSDLVIVEGFSRPVTGQARMRSPWLRRLTTDGASILLLNRALARNLIIGSMAQEAAHPRPLGIAGPLAAKLGGSIVYLQRDDEAQHAAELKCDILVLDETQTDPTICAALMAKGRCSVLILRQH